MGERFPGNRRRFFSLCGFILKRVERLNGVGGKSAGEEVELAGTSFGDDISHSSLFIYQIHHVKTIDDEIS